MTNSSEKKALPGMSNKITAVLLLAAVLLAMILMAAPFEVSVAITALIASALFLWVLWQRPDWGMYAIISSLAVYFYAILNIGGVNIRIYNTLSLILLFIILLKRRGRVGLPQIVPVSIYLTALGLSLPASADQVVSLKYILFQAFGFLLMWVTYNLIRHKKDLLRYLYFLLLLGNIDTLLIILNTALYVLGLPTFAPIAHTDVLPIGRPNLFLGEPDRTAEFHLILLLITLPFIFARKSSFSGFFSKQFIWISFILNLYIVTVGIFRSAWVGVVVALVSYVVIAYSQGSGIRITKRIVVYLVPILLGLLLVAILSPAFIQATYGRFDQSIRMWQEQRMEVQSDLSVNLKILELGLERPWLGWGIGVDEAILDPAELFVYHLPAISEGYNRLIRMFYGAGIVGLLGYVVWQLSYLRRILKTPGQLELKAAFVLPVIGLYWGHDMFRMVQIAPAIFLVMGLALAWRRISLEEQAAAAAALKEQVS